MSWDLSLRDQVLEAFREAQRRPGELDTADERTVPLTASNAVEKSDTRPVRRIATRRTA